MSSRPPGYADRRSNGTTDSDGTQRPRAGAGSGASQASADPRSGRSSQPGFTNPAHKRSASGNPRPASRAVEERRTEKFTVTTREKLISRTRSSDGRPKDAVQQDKERRKTKEASRPRQPEAKLRESKSEPLPSEGRLYHVLCMPAN